MNLTHGVTSFFSRERSIRSVVAMSISVAIARSRSSPPPPSASSSPPPSPRKSAAAAAIDDEKWPYEISARSRIRKIFRPWLASVGLRIQIGLTPRPASSLHTRTIVMYSVGSRYASGKKS